MNNYRSSTVVSESLENVRVVQSATVQRDDRLGWAAHGTTAGLCDISRLKAAPIIETSRVAIIDLSQITRVPSKQETCLLRRAAPVAAELPNLAQPTVNAALPAIVRSVRVAAKIRQVPSELLALHAEMGVTTWLLPSTRMITTSAMIKNLALPMFKKNKVFEM
ncbi:uncharacterized protein LOC126095463 [Schistocerca cancellata]|uniref:uncharacterized protein LOC126095463 n=1 Tax=Schistocerca cancellata TaxID=274614 RepID=UPI0021191501|nr:uncharacterized protein LOC126095463 [Schistocerca cancellata]